MGLTLGIAGTAKNTGKTTTLQAVVRFLRERRTGVFLTSIGYDGEDVDTVTGLPKPKVIVEEGDTVATALPLFRSSPARFAGLQPTGVDCALGPVYSGTAVSPGRVVLAGPVSTKDVASVIKGAPADKTVLLDGAFSRLAPMVLADALILATGAARSPDPRRIAAEMEALSVVFGLPEPMSTGGAGARPSGGEGLPSGSGRLPSGGEGLPSGGERLPSGSERLSSGSERLPSDADLLRFPEGLFVEGQDSDVAARVAEALGLGPAKVLSSVSGSGSGRGDGASRWAPHAAPSEAISCETTFFDRMIKRVPTLSPGAISREATSPAVTVQIDGVVNPTVFSSMVEKVWAAAGGNSQTTSVSGSGSPSSPLVEFVLAHPVFMLLSGDIADWVRALERAHSRGFRVSVRRRQNLLGFTVNPFRPVFDPIRNAYTALYVDAALYLREIRCMTGVPTTDIVYEGTAALESWLEEAGLLGS
ncbi:MAG: hypothetical protein ACOX5Q_00620 [Bacillota bacterium]